MKTNWDLTVFYKDFDDPEFKDDLARLPKEIDAFTAAIAAPAEDEVEKLVSLVHQEEALSNLFERGREQQSCQRRDGAADACCHGLFAGIQRLLPLSGFS